MTIFYFTSTGNCLAVAKKIADNDGTLISIPQIIDNPIQTYKDDVIGIVFPIYGFHMPKICRKFLAKAKWKADYTFAIGTYGNMSAACMRNTQRYAAEHGNPINYANSLLMVDNYLPGFEIAKQIAELPEKNTETNLSQIVRDIQSKKPLEAKASIVQRILTALVHIGEKSIMKDTQAQNYIVNGNCTKCGTCAKICPVNNITVTDKVIFGDHCEWCLGCVHLCPQKAIHMKSEKSAERWRNPDVTFAEIIKSNDRTKDNG